jgi:glycosyltransferase involved in cell wall biosynthesis
VVITTRNRKEELRAAIRSALAQTVPVEVLVIDDGSDDGTADLVRREFPAVRLVREERARGYIARRNQAAGLASAPVLVSIDDDAIFSSPSVVGQTLRDFDHPRVGAVGIPFVNVRQGRVVQQRAPGDEAVYVTDSYIGTAHALRRELFVQLGGYREHLVHQGEEGDFCLRLLQAGYLVRLGRAEPIHHFESPRRDFRRMDYYGRRNDVLFAWHNVPLPYLPVHLAATTLNGLRTALRARRLRHQLWGLAAGYLSCLAWGGRRPVGRAAYRLSRRLKKAGPLPLAEIEPLLAAMNDLPSASSISPPDRPGEPSPAA